MSPSPDYRTRWPGRFPRVSGDEPTIETAADLAEMFSPRERG